jgi:cytochrome c-type biogenesis protein CcmH/NrfF
MIFFSRLSLGLDKKNPLWATIFFVLLVSSGLSGESISTNLTDPNDILVYHDVTSKIRCICLPSLPIKSCSYNNCAVSAELKLFIENRIRKGESSDTIVQKLLTGFGEEAMEDPIIQKFKESGSLNMVNGVLYGFGDKILAEPSSIFINMTIIGIGLMGLVLIYFYFKTNRKINPSTSQPIQLSKSSEKYLKELD